MEPALGHLTLHSIPLFTQETAFPWQPPLAPSCPLLQPHKFCLAKKSWLWLEIMVGALIIFQQVPTGQVPVVDMKRQPLRGQHCIVPCWGPFTLFLSKSSQAQGSRQKHPQLGKSHFKQKPCWAVSASKARPGNDWAALGGARE